MQEQKKKGPLFALPDIKLKGPKKLEAPNAEDLLKKVSAIPAKPLRRKYSVCKICLDEGASVERAARCDARGRVNIEINEGDEDKPYNPSSE